MFQIQKRLIISIQSMYKKKNRKAAGENVVDKPPIGLVNPNAHDGALLLRPTRRDGSNEYTGIEVDESHASWTQQR